MNGPMTEFEKRHGANLPSALYRPDVFPLAWIQMCNGRARGEAPAPMPVSLNAARTAARK